MKDVRISAEAISDLDEIWLHIAADNPDAADRVIDALYKTIRDTLAMFPDAGRTRDELAPGLRSFPVGGHVIFYMPGAEAISIVRILHGARDLDDVFRG
jgi:toxin ParE1/3/4